MRGPGGVRPNLTTMSHYQPAPEGKDPVLWEIAQKRASFKTHAVTYIIVNAFLWAFGFYHQTVII